MILGVDKSSRFKDIGQKVQNIAIQFLRKYLRAIRAVPGICRKA